MLGALIDIDSAVYSSIDLSVYFYYKEDIILRLIILITLKSGFTH